jgi:hypothetical protein
MKFLVVLAVLVAGILAGGAWYWVQNKSVAPVADTQNLTFTVEGQSVTLVNGHAETPVAPGSASSVATDYFGNEATGDVNGDGEPDKAFLITQDPGGTGTFYYIVVALKTVTGYEGTTAALLGDRIAPQTVGIRNGEVVVNYAERAPGDPMTAEPSVGVTKYFWLQGSALVAAPRIVGAGEFCGGNMATASVCVSGYHCAPAQGSHLPFGDVGGTCVAN